MLRSRNKLNAVGLIEFIEQEIFVQIPCTVSAKLDEKKDDVSSRSAKWKAALSEPVGQAMWSMLVKTDSYGVLRGWTVDRFAEEVAAMCEVMESVDWPAEFSAMVGKGAPTIADQIMAVDAMWRGNRLKGVGTVVMKACCRLIPVQYSRYNYVWENGPLIEASRSLVLAEEEEERAFLKTLAARKRKSSQ
ncbi:hypothetical protein RvY_12944 [Ramazzottius varieornatus]|uniref:Uncharacterized protein n=1 Tax=Ramazzottius varieornatus TaxID=947166 RepID=A0A1D1VRL0_RAMVA|nr:hypothetical protein RvY_12944 [Ramazzottius varieornatus]